MVMLFLFTFFKFFLAFCIAFITDIVWAKWSKYTNQHRAHLAAIMSVGMIVCGSLYTLAVVRADWVIIFGYITGAYVGTWYEVKK